MLGNQRSNILKLLLSLTVSCLSNSVFTLSLFYRCKIIFTALSFLLTLFLSKFLSLFLSLSSSLSFNLCLLLSLPLCLCTFLSLTNTHAPTLAATSLKRFHQSFKAPWESFCTRRSESSTYILNLLVTSWDQWGTRYSSTLLSCNFSPPLSVFI